MSADSQLPAWPTLRQLEYVVAVSATLNFREAARRCHVSQPTLSAQIQQLEAALGVTLLERDRRHVAVTAAGEEIARRAARVLADVSDLVAAARRYGEPLCGELRVGAIPTVGPYLLPRVVPRLTAAFPELRMLLREEPTARLVEQLRSGELDVALLALEADLGNLATEPLFRDRFVLAAHADHPLCERESVTLDDLEDESLLLLDEGHCLSDQAFAFCDGRAVSVHPFRATSLSTLVQMVAGGVGVTLLPDIAVELEVRAGVHLGVVPFADPVPSRTLGLAWRASSPREPEFLLLADALRPLGGRDALPSRARPRARAPGAS